MTTNNSAASPIPCMTHELGKYWDQPKQNELQFSKNNVTMSKKVFSQLKDYSCSIPTGAYEGKMWKRRELQWRDIKGVSEDGKKYILSAVGYVWFLCWYGTSEEPNMVSINSLPIKISKS